MDRLWTPWRYGYVTGSNPGRKGVPAALQSWPGEDKGCVFCNMLAAVAWAKDTGMGAEEAEHAAYIVGLWEHCFVCLNAFPYSTGHLMILPYLHTPSLQALPVEAAHQMIDLARAAEGWLNRIYRPDGLNLGINMGQAAGAGVAGHLHLHALPRWAGDTSFITTVSETRVLPESLDVTWKKLRKEVTAEATRNSLQTSTQ